jgi:hypothetical protein
MQVDVPGGEFTIAKLIKILGEGEKTVGRHDFL